MRRTEIGTQAVVSQYNTVPSGRVPCRLSVVVFHLHWVIDCHGVEQERHKKRDE